MSLQLSCLVVALHHVLHEQPVKQWSVIGSSMVVKVVRDRLGADRQLACGWRFVLPQELVWRLDLHIESLPYFVMIVGRPRIAYQKFVFPKKLPYEDVQERPGSRFRHDCAMQPLGPCFDLFQRQ